MIRVHVDVALERAPEVIAGVRAWERATDGYRRWELSGPAGANLTIIEVTDGKAHCDDPGYPIAACASQIGGLDDDEAPHGKIWLLRGHYEGGARWVTMHEIGHTLGLQHQDGGIMQARGGAWDTPDCPDEVTLMRLRWRTGYPFVCRAE